MLLPDKACMHKDNSLTKHTSSFYMYNVPPHNILFHLYMARLGNISCNRNMDISAVYNSVVFSNSITYTVSYTGSRRRALTTLCSSSYIRTRRQSCMSFRHLKCSLKPKLTCTHTRTFRILELKYTALILSFPWLRAGIVQPISRVPMQTKTHP